MAIREIVPDRALINELQKALRRRIDNCDYPATDYEKQLLMRAGVLESGRWQMED